MRNNCATANDKIYVQKTETAIGTQVGTHFANLFLYYKFKHVFEDTSVIFQERYVDGSFVISKSRGNAYIVMDGMKGASNLDFSKKIPEFEIINLAFHVYK